jgi:hypothetical protein
MRRRLVLAALWSLAFVPPLSARVASTWADDPTGAPPAPPADPDADDPDRGRVGFAARLAEAMKPDERTKLGIAATKGCVIADVRDNSPAFKAGMKVGDVLVKFNGQPVPESTVKETDDEKAKEEGEKTFTKAFQALGKSVKPGDAVPIVLSRGGKEIAISPIAVTREFLEEEALYPPVPEPATAGPAAAAKLDFENVPEGKSVPDGFLHFLGMWEVHEEDGATPANHVLEQGSMADPWALLLVTGAGRAYSDGKASVRWKVPMPEPGQEDASGGIAFRALDRKNYYLVRGNALENNFRLYVVQNGMRRDLASVDVEMPKPGTWHTIEVEFVGTRLKATLDGKTPVEATDDTWKSGWCGLWTKKDSTTLFDDFVLTPAAGK